MATKKNESYWHNASLQAIGVMVVLLLVLPSIIRRGQGEWAGIDWAVLIMGVLLGVTWCFVMLVRMVRQKRDRRGTGRPGT